MRTFKIFLALTAAVVIFGSCNSSTNSQPFFSWAKAVGSTQNDYVRAMETDSSGNIYYTGSFNGESDGSEDFDPGEEEDFQSGLSTYDLFLTKLNADGTYGWTKVIIGSGFESGSCICFDSNDNIYLGGTFDETVDFDPGTETTDNKTSAGDRDMFVTKFSANGTYLWTKTFGGELNESINGIAVDSTGILYIAGHFKGTVDFNPGTEEDVKTCNNSSCDLFLTKINADDTYDWTKVIGGSDSDYLKCMTLDSSDNIYLGGSFKGTVDFDPGTETDEKTAVRYSDIFFTRFNADGTYGWTKTMGGRYNEAAYSIVADASGNIYVTGGFAGTVDFDPGEGTDEKTAGTTTSVNAFVSKFDTDGSYFWTGTFTERNTLTANSIAVDGLGNLFITGIFKTTPSYPTVDFDPGEGTTDEITSADGNSDIYLTKLNADGTYEWTKVMGGILSEDSISVDIYNSTIYIAGIFSGTSDFDPGDGILELTSNGFNDIFIFKGNL